VQRHFKATSINQLWIADMAYIPTWAGFLYLVVVIDVFSRKVAVNITSVEFGKRCKEMGMSPFMGSVVDAYDIVMTRGSKFP
jgi:putative transposase